MKNALWCLVAVALLPLAGCAEPSDAAQPGVTTSNEATTRLYVRSLPAGAEVRVDGQSRGPAPQLIDVPAGATSMTIEVALPGGESQRRVVEIAAGRITRVEFEFGEGSTAVAATRPRPRSTTTAQRTRGSTSTTSRSAIGAAGWIMDRIANPPDGWTLQQVRLLNADDIATIQKRLGAPITRATNAFFSAHGETVQVNVLECLTDADAEKAHEAILAMKGDPAYCLRFDTTIVEFVGTFDAAFARRAARELGLTAPGRRSRYAVAEIGPAGHNAGCRGPAGN